MGSEKWRDRFEGFFKSPVRTCLGLVLAPAAGTVFNVAYMFTPTFRGLGVIVFDAAEGYALALAMLIPGYVLAVLIGAPIFLLVHLLCGVRWWSSLIGAFVGLGILWGPVLYAGSERGLAVSEMLLSAGGTALAYGLAFWLMAVREPGVIGWKSERGNA